MTDMMEWPKYRHYPSTLLDIEYLLHVITDEAKLIDYICSQLPPVYKLITFNDFARALTGYPSPTQKQYIMYHATMKMSSLPIYERNERLLVKDTDDFELIARGHCPNDLFVYAMDWLAKEYGPYFGNPVSEIQESGTIRFKHPNAPPRSPGLMLIPVKGPVT